MRITDEKLFQLCKTFGARALLWRQKFIGLLPEVNRRKLYEKKGFGSIFEFAAKLAGVSEEQVNCALNLHKRFDDKPLLKKILINGEVSINKLARIASVVTAENQEFWANQVILLPSRALETLVRDAKNPLSQDLRNQKPDELFVHVQMNAQQNTEDATEPNTLSLSQEVTQKLLKLQNKGIDINSLILDFMEQRERGISQEKERLATEAKPTNSRYIPVAVREIIAQEHGTKCSIDGCTKEAEELHHAQRFSLASKHDPRFLAPLCKNHHVIAHSIDVKFHEARIKPHTDS